MDYYILSVITSAALINNFMFKPLLKRLLNL